MLKIFSSITHAYKTTIYLSTILTLYLGIYHCLPAFSQESERKDNYTTFQEWCDNKANVSEATKHTINVLLETVDTKDCQNANRQLSRTDIISIFRRIIKDVRPISSLTNIKIVNLKFNDITDISSLAYLTNLIEIDLWNNQVYDISSLAKLTKLKNINLINNPITDISPLSNLTNLTNLALVGNKFTDLSALSNLTKLSSIALNRNQITDITPL